MKALYAKIKEVEGYLNNYLAFFFANGNKQDRISNYHDEN